MKTIWKTMTIVLLAVMLVLGSGCKKEIDVCVTTYTPQDITTTTALCGCDAIVNQGITLAEIGVCWGLKSNPTVEGFHQSTIKWTEPFICSLTGLVPDTTYYVRAYALLGLEYYYGEEKVFNTEKIESIPPSISILQAPGWSFVQDGDILDLDKEYLFGFEVSSETELASLRINVDDLVWDELDLTGLTSYSYSEVIVFTSSKLRDEIIGEATIRAVVSDTAGGTNSASIHVMINKPDLSQYFN